MKLIVFLIIYFILKLNPFDTQKVNEPDKEAVRTRGAWGMWREEGKGQGEGRKGQGEGRKWDGERGGRKEERMEERGREKGKKGSEKRERYLYAPP